MELKHKLTVGADPEVFLYDVTTARIIPAVGLIGGTKDEPKKISEQTMIQEDNVTVEFNVEPVEHTYGSRALANTTSASLSDVSTYLQKISKMYGLEIVSEHEFQGGDLATEQARRFGCEPDLNAHMGGAQNPIFEASQVGNYRFCGGHIHLGFSSEVEAPKRIIVQMLDALVTLPALFDHGMSVIGNVRRKYYGKAGAYRDKPYGLEYRTPSNYWLQSPTLATMYCDVALWIMNNPSEASALYDRINFGVVVDAINSEHGPTDALYNLMIDLRAPIDDEVDMYRKIIEQQKPLALNLSMNPLLGPRGRGPRPVVARQPRAVNMVMQRIEELNELNRQNDILNQPIVQWNVPGGIGQLGELDDIRPDEDNE